MNKKKIQVARNKIDQLDKKILYLIKKRTAIIKYMLKLKGFKKQIVDHKRNKEILINLPLLTSWRVNLKYLNEVF